MRHASNIFIHTKIYNIHIFTRTNKILQGYISLYMYTHWTKLKMICIKKRACVLRARTREEEKKKKKKKLTDNATKRRRCVSLWTIIKLRLEDDNLFVLFSLKFFLVKYNLVTIINIYIDI